MLHLRLNTPFSPALGIKLSTIQLSSLSEVPTHFSKHLETKKLLLSDLVWQQHQHGGGGGDGGGGQLSWQSETE